MMTIYIFPKMKIILGKALKYEVTSNNSKRDFVSNQILFCVFIFIKCQQSGSGKQFSRKEYLNL